MLIGGKTIAWTFLRKLWQRRWYAAAVAWIFCIAGWIYVVHLPDMFEAKARIYVDIDSLLRPLMRGIALDSNISTQVDLMQRTLLSRPNLQKVIQLSDIDLSARTPLDEEEVINNLRRRTTIVGDGRNLFTISSTAADRATATKVVQALLTVFVESNLGNSRKDFLSARAFIDEQLRDYAKQLDAAEKRVADFKAKYAGFLPGDSNFTNRLETAREELGKTQAELDENRYKRDALRHQLTSVPKTVESMSSGPDEFGAGPPLGRGGDASLGPGSDLRVSELEQKLNTLLENYTDQHPDVIKTRRLLEEAKQRASEDQDKLSQSPLPTNPGARRTTAPNPVYDQLQLQLVALETTIASLESRLKRNQAEVEKWQGLAKSVPETAAELAKLTRDYDVIKRAYDELLSRRESAKIGSDLETQTQTVQFRVVDPPEAPPIPIAPKRPLLLAAVLVAGFLAGGALAFLLAQIDDSVITVRQLKDIVPLPVLGAISIVVTPTAKRKQAWQAMSFIAVCLMLLVVFAGILSFEALGIRA